MYFYYIIQTLDTNHSLLSSEWKVRSDKWNLIQNKQTPTPTQTQTETAMRSLPGGKSSWGLNTSSETIFEQWKDENSSKKKGQANNILTEKKN